MARGRNKSGPNLVEPAVITPTYFTAGRARSMDGTIHITLSVEQQDFADNGRLQAVVVGRLICSHDAAVSLGLSLQQTLADVLMREGGRKKG